ncbi:MAG: arginase family protein [Candidatus Tyrphobacter sp.]
MPETRRRKRRSAFFTGQRGRRGRRTAARGRDRPRDDRTHRRGLPAKWVALVGDHSITYPIVRAYAQQYGRLSVVHFDAHPDLYASFQGNRFSHACPFARILEGFPALRLVQIGIRTTTADQRGVAGRYDIAVFGPDELDAPKSALPDGPVYVTLDLDGLDSAFDRDAKSRWFYSDKRAAGTLCDRRAALRMATRRLRSLRSG